MTENIELLKRKLAFRSNLRGMRELDYYVGAFANKYLATLDSKELKQYEKLLDAEDPMVLDWLLGTKTIPDEYNNEVWKKFKTITSKDFQIKG